MAEGEVVETPYVGSKPTALTTMLTLYKYWCRLDVSASSSVPDLKKTKIFQESKTRTKCYHREGVGTTLGTRLPNPPFPRRLDSIVSHFFAFVNTFFEICATILQNFRYHLVSALPSRLCHPLQLFPKSWVYPHAPHYAFFLPHLLRLSRSFVFIYFPISGICYIFYPLVGVYYISLRPSPPLLYHISHPLSSKIFFARGKGG